MTKLKPMILFASAFFSLAVAGCGTQGAAARAALDVNVANKEGTARSTATSNVEDAITIRKVVRNGTLGWKITCWSRVPITIQKVLLNGQFECPLADMQSYGMTVSRNKFPILLNLGDQIRVAEEWSDGHYNRIGPGFEVLLVEVYTDRGIRKITPDDPAFLKGDLRQDTD